jgi:hypothetical protein
MTAKIRVVFDMSFDEGGECKTSISFAYPEHPDLVVDDTSKKLLIEEIYLLSGAANAAKNQLFSK